MGNIDKINCLLPHCLVLFLVLPISVWIFDLWLVQLEDLLLENFSSLYQARVKWSRYRSLDTSIFVVDVISQRAELTEFYIILVIFFISIWSCFATEWVFHRMWGSRGLLQHICSNIIIHSNVIIVFIFFSWMVFSSNVEPWMARSVPTHYSLSAHVTGPDFWLRRDRLITDKWHGKTDELSWLPRVSGFMIIQLW